MKIALIGYGKMGHAIEQVAKQRGHEIVLTISSANKNMLTSGNICKADVAIEFTGPESARKNVVKCLESGVPVICGSTGWNTELGIAHDAAEKNNTAFLQASNFSVGVNIFFEVNKMLAQLMSTHSDYEVFIEETHHTQKKDAPSGTAITIAEQIIQNLSGKKQWALNDLNEPDAIPIMAHRLDNIPGTHKVSYRSSIDDIEITHTAHNREGFAKGAVLAAEFIIDKRGVFEMKDVLGIK